MAYAARPALLARQVAPLEKRAMKIALYARISTDDDRQNLETQLQPLRLLAATLGDVTAEYVDRASARDILHRTGWRQLLDDAAHKQFDLVLVHKMDRAFRSIKDMYDTLAAWDLAGIGFRSATQPFDTTTAMGRLMMALLAAMAEFELELIRERIRAGMERAAREGRFGGRPRLDVQPALLRRFRRVLPRLAHGDLTRTQAAAVLGISRRSLGRLLDHKES